MAWAVTYLMGFWFAGVGIWLWRRNQLTSAVHTAVRGDRLLAPALLRRLLDDVLARAAPRTRPVPGIDELTPREEEVLRLMARGLSNAELAETLVLGRGP